MKQLLLSSLILLLAFTIHAQIEGTIKYVQVTQLDFEAPEGMEEMFKNMPKEQTNEKVLIFSGKQSIYQNPDDKIGNDDNVVNLESEGMSMTFDFQQPDEKLYMDLDARKTLDQKDFMGKQFLVEGSPRKIDWKLGKGKKKIAGHICIEATTMESDTIPVTAWFSPKIKSSIGPDGYGGLPGMILQIDKSNGDHLITATEVNLNKPNMDLISAPTKGKKISQEKYEQVVAEKLAEMKAQTSGSGSTFIEIRQ